MKFAIFLESSLLFNSFYCLFLFINKTSQLNKLKTRTAINVKISVFLICVTVIIYLFYHLHDCTFNTFLNIKTTTTLNWWSFAPMVVLVALQFSWFNFTFSVSSPCFKHSYNTETAITANTAITNECFKIFKVCIDWTNVGMKQTKIISLT